MKEKGHLHPVNLRVERNMEVIFCSFFLLVDDAGVKIHFYPSKYCGIDFVPSLLCGLLGVYFKRFDDPDLFCILCHV